MNEFFHNYPICPNCLSPLVNYSEVKLTDKKKETYRCENCGSHFYNRFHDENYDRGLFWKINLNRIEKSYIAFLNKQKKGKYLITWPWEDVKFSPVLAANYLINNPNHRVIIVDNLIKQEDSIYRTPSADVLFDYLFFMNSKDAKTEKYDESLIAAEKVFENRKKFYCDITLIKRNLKFYENLSNKKITFIKDKIRIEVDYEENKFKQFRKNIIKKIENLYSEESIFSVRVAHENKLPKRMDDYGIFSLYFNIDEGIENNVELNENLKKEYGKLLPNILKLKKATKKINSIAIHEDKMLNKDLRDYNLIFIDDTIDSYKLMNFVSRVNPNITIFNRADIFFERSLIFNRGFEFNNFINNANNMVLLFSTFRDNRGLYKIGDETSILNELNIIPHTWDFKDIIDKTIPNNNQISLGTSNLDEVKSSTNIPIEYCTIDSLSTIENTFSSIMEFYKNNHLIKSFLIDLIRTPLYLAGYFRDKKVFRKRNFSFESFFATIYNRDEELGIELDAIYDSVYHYNDNNTNPISERIISLLKDFKFKRNDNIICIVDSYEIKGLKEIIELHIDDENILNHVKYSSWDKLNEFKFEKNENYYIISTRRPYISFKLNDHDFKKIYFVGSPSIIDDLKIEITKRLTDQGTRPIFLFNETNKNYAPNLLFKSINSIKHLPKNLNTPENKLNSKLNYQYNKEITKTYDIKVNNYKNTKNKFNIRLESDDNVVLVISKNKNGMFLPLYNNIYIKNKNGGVEEIKTSNETCNNLINKEIILDSEGFYTSFRLLFFKFIAEYKAKIPIINRDFQWNDFKSLLQDAFQWVEILRKLSIKYSELNTNFMIDPKYKLAYTISKLQLYAKDPDYIKKFWLSDPVYIETSKGEIPIYENEHPKTRNDLVLLYKWINDNFEDIELTDRDAHRSFSASTTMQKIRSDFLHKRKNKIPYAHLNMYFEFEKSIDRILLNADSFEVSFADVVQINDNVTPYKVISDYKKYLK